MASGNIANTIQQLNQARNLCLADPNSLYPQIVPGLAPIINSEADLELRRWGTDFLAETFASPVLAAEHKQKLSVQVLDGLKGYLEKQSEDATVVKSVVQAAASIYPFVFRHIISNPNDAPTWQKMAAIKSNILRRMDNEPPGVRLCCVKFIQSVVQVQTPGMIADPRRPDQNEISLALVPRDHPVIPPSNLEAEASGLLDRLLSVIQDNSSEALILTATLNSLGSLVRSRASVSNKIISTILNFNPFSLAQSRSPLSAKDKVLIRSMTRTTMSFLGNILKRNPNHPLAGRIQGTIDRLRHSLVDVFDQTSRKRPAPAEPTDGLSDSKRQRLGAEVPASSSQPPSYPPLPPGPVSYAQLFTLTQDKGAQGFDVKSIPIDLVMRVLPPLLAAVDRSRLDNAINAVRARYLALSNTTQPPTALAASKIATGVEPSPGDEDDDYDPDAGFPYESSEQVLNQLDQAGDDDAAAVQPPEVALGPFSLPPPPPLNSEEAIDHSKGAVNRVFATLSALDASAPAKPKKHGLNRLAASTNDKDTWVTIISRLATRSSAGLDDASAIKTESELSGRPPFSASNAIRDALCIYIIDDFRRRIDVAITWLNEEWYSDRIAERQFEADKISSSSPDLPSPKANYEPYLHRILDATLPFLDAKDKFLIRFLSEIPALDAKVLSKVAKLAADPERVNLAVMALQYLVMLRPPVRELALDALEAMGREFEDARGGVGKVLAKWRPGVVFEEGKGVKAEA